MAPAAPEGAAGGAVFKDSNASHLLDFSDTDMSAIAEVNARGGNDTVIASNLGDGAYRGGSGNDSLVAGDAGVAWLYVGAKNGFDSFTNGSGVSVAVAEAVVREDGLRVVTAFVVPATGVTFDADDLVAHAREHLAAYKCPRAVRVVEALPRTPNGKVLRRVLAGGA